MRVPLAKILVKLYKFSISFRSYTEKNLSPVFGNSDPKLETPSPIWGSVMASMVAMVGLTAGCWVC